MVRSKTFMILAYADGLAFIASTEEEMRQMRIIFKRKEKKKRI